jgi:hypothetical protein
VISDLMRLAGWTVNGVARQEQLISIVEVSRIA